VSYLAIRVVWPSLKLSREKCELLKQLIRIHGPLQAIPPEPSKLTKVTVRTEPNVPEVLFGDTSFPIECNGA